MCVKEIKAFQSGRWAPFTWALGSTMAVLMGDGILRTMG